MKKFFLVFTLINSISALADVTVTGKMELKQYSAIENQSNLIISGNVARKIWDDMVAIPVTKPNQYQPNDMKYAKDVNCEKIVSGEVFCYILLNSAEGKVIH